MRHHRIGLMRGAFALLVNLLAACTGGVGERSAQTPVSPVAVASVGGTVTGMAGSSGLVLQINGGATITVAGDGSFTFPQGIAQDSLYNITVLQQPTAQDGTPQTCTVSNGAGTASSTAISITITCTPKQAVTDVLGGTVAGLAGTGLVLQNIDGTRLAVTGNGPFVLAGAVAPGTSYAVTVLSQPLNPDQVCTIANGSGITGNADVTSIAVSCLTPKVATYTVGLTVTGLTGTGAGIVLQDNGRDPLTVTADGNYTFGLAIPDGGSYSVSAPAGGGSQSVTCALSNASGVIQGANVTNVQVSCQVNGEGGPPTPRYTVGGTLTGLTGSQSTLTLTNGAGESIALTADGPFTFPTPLINGSAYAVTVQGVTGGSASCSVSNGSGTLAGAAVTNVVVTCTPGFTVGGTVSGLSGNDTVLLRLNGGAQQTAGNGAFTFASTPLANGTAYTVTALLSTGAACPVTNGSGTVNGANITNVAVSCQGTAPTAYKIGGTVSGLTQGAGVILVKNDQELLTVQSNGAFAFQGTQLSGSSYDVAISDTTGNVTCTISGNTGVVGTADVTSIGVSCTALAGGSPPVYLPFVASPTGETGQSGLFIVPSDNIAQAPRFLNTQPVQFLGTSVRATLSDGVVARASRVAAFYATVGPLADDLIHIYAVDLSDTSTTPVPRQISTLGLLSLNQVCSATVVQRDLKDPRTAALLLHVTATPATTCGGETDLFYLLQAADPPTLPPVTVAISLLSQIVNDLPADSSVDSVYQADGTLAGLVLADGLTRNLVFYSDPSFQKPPTVLATNVTAKSPLLGSVQGVQRPIGSLFESLSINDQQTMVLRVDAGGQPVQVYLTALGQPVDAVAGGTGAVADDRSIYFTNTQADGEGGVTTQLIEAPLSGATSTKVLYDAPGSCALVGSNNSNVVFYCASTTTAALTLGSVPVDVTSTTTTDLGSTPGISGGVPLAYLAAPPGNLPAAGVLVTRLGFNSDQTVAYTSRAVSPDGRVLQEAQTGSAWLATNPMNGIAIQARGITDSSFSMGGASLLPYDIARNTFGAPFTGAGGGAYTVPTGLLPAAAASVEGDVSVLVLAAINTNVNLLSVALLDSGRNLIVPISMAQTNVWPYGNPPQTQVSSALAAARTVAH